MNWVKNTSLPSNIEYSKHGAFILYRKWKPCVMSYCYGFDIEGHIWFESEQQIIKFLTL